MGADIHDASMPKIYKIFPEVTTVLIRNEPAKVNRECDRNFTGGNENLEAHSSKLDELYLGCKQLKGVAKSQNGTSNILEKLKFKSDNLSLADGFIENEHVPLDQSTSKSDLSLTKMDVKDHYLNSDVVSQLRVAEDGSMLNVNGTSAVKIGAVERQKSEMRSQGNSTLSEENSAISLNGLNRTVSNKEDDILNDYAGKKEVCVDAKTSKSTKKDHFEIFVLAKKGVIPGHEEMTQLKNDFAVAPGSLDHMVIKVSFDETRPDNNNHSQKQKFYFHCQICNKTFDDLQGHIKLHSGDKPFRCSVCGISFKKERHLLVHQSVHKDERPFTCNTCGKGFKRPDTLAKHQQTHVGLKCYLCNVCGKSYVSKFVLKRHQVVHSNERPFACDLCDRKFRIKYDLTVHKRRHIDDKPFSCKECGKKFTNAAHVATHMLIHKNERSFVCSVCSKSFLRKEHLVRHFTNVHVGERNFACHVCKKRFKRPEVLKAHLLTHSKREEFVCKQCGKSYTTKWNLKAHTIRHKNKEKLQKKDKVCSEEDA